METLLTNLQVEGLSGAQRQEIVDKAVSCVQIWRHAKMDDTLHLESWEPEAPSFNALAAELCDRRTTGVGLSAANLEAIVAAGSTSGEPDSPCAAKTEVEMQTEAGCCAMRQRDWCAFLQK